MVASEQLTEAAKTVERVRDQLWELIPDLNTQRALQGNVARVWLELGRMAEALQSISGAVEDES